MLPLLSDVLRFFTRRGGRSKGIGFDGGGLATSGLALPLVIALPLALVEDSKRVAFAAESGPPSVAARSAEEPVSSEEGRRSRPVVGRLRELWAQEKLQTQWPGTFLGLRVLGAAGLKGLPLASRTPNATGVFTDFQGGAEFGGVVGVTGRHWGAAVALEYAPLVLLPSPYSSVGSALRVGVEALWVPRGDWSRWTFEAGLSPWSTLRASSQAGQGYILSGIGYRLGARYRWLALKRWDLECYFGLRADRFAQVDTGFAGSSKRFAIAEFSGGSGEATATVALVGVQFSFRKE